MPKSPRPKHGRARHPRTNPPRTNPPRTNPPRTNGHANGKASGPSGLVAISTQGSGATPLAKSPRRLPVVAEPREQVPCLSCGLCCSYVAVEIDGPTTVKAATNILWYLYHQNICIYAEDDEWMVQVEARCQHYQDDHKCGIYETRPQICRDYDETACEINAEEVGTVFYSAGEFLSYMQQHHKRIHALIKKRYMPPEESLGGRSLGRKRVGPFRPRYDALRTRASGSA